MDIQYNIQSYKRAGNVLTLSLLPHANVWVHEFEVKEYQEAYPEANIIILPDDLQGNVAKVKNYILNLKKDSDVNVMLDDDIFSFGYYEKVERKVLEDIESFVEKYSIIAEGFGAKLWGIQVNSDKQSYREYSPFSTVSYVSSSFSCFLKGNECRYDERLPLKEDYDMTIQQCNTYRKIIRVNKFFYEKKSETMTGGCAMYRNITKEDEQFSILQKKWGSKIVKKDSMKSSRSHGSSKKRKIDINPIIHVPIRGI